MLPWRPCQHHSHCYHSDLFMWALKHGASSPGFMFHWPLRCEVTGAVSGGLFVFINSNTCLSSYWKTVCFVCAPLAQSIWSNLLTCKELLHVAGSKRSSALCIDPPEDLLLYSAPLCCRAIERKDFHHVAGNSCWIRWTIPPSSFWDWTYGCNLVLFVVLLISAFNTKLKVKKGARAQRVQRTKMYTWCKGQQSTGGARNLYLAEIAFFCFYNVLLKGLRTENLQKIETIFRAGANFTCQKWFGFAKQIVESRK